TAPGTPPAPATWWRRRAATPGGASALWRSDAHPDTADGVQVARFVRGFAELAAQPGQVHVDRFVGTAVGQLPHLGQQLALADHFTGACGQVVQQSELPWGQVQGPALQGRL